jgi:hypothetical protein
MATDSVDQITELKVRMSAVETETRLGHLARSEFREFMSTRLDKQDKSLDHLDDCIDDLKSLVINLSTANAVRKAKFTTARTAVVAVWTIATGLAALWFSK